MDSPVGQPEWFDRHPAGWPDENLLAVCDTIRQRRSGPGGQHRNKVETAIRLEHRPTGITAQASERRSQADNLREALFRLRLELALQIRTESPPADIPSETWRSRCRDGKLSVNPRHAEFPGLLAEGLDVLQHSDWDHKRAAEHLGLSPSQLLKFLKREPRAWQLLNQHRQSDGLHPLS